jgi:hypothetical protein
VLGAQSRPRPGRNVEPVVVSSVSLRSFPFLRLLGRASSYSRFVLDAGSLVRTELRPSVNFLIFESLRATTHHLWRAVTERTSWC